MKKPNKKLTFDSKSKKESIDSLDSTAKNNKDSNENKKKSKENKNIKKEQNKKKKESNFNKKEKEKKTADNKIEEETKTKNNIKEKDSPKTKEDNNKENNKFIEKSTNESNNSLSKSHISKEKKDKSNIKQKVQSKHEKIKTKKELRAEKKEKKIRKQKIIRISLIVAGSVFAIYILGVILFNFVCFPNTTVANVDLSLKNPDMMKDEIKNNAQDYTLTIGGYDFNLVVFGNQIDYSFDADQVIHNIKMLNNPFCWPIELFAIHDFMDDSIIRFDNEKAKQIISSGVQTHNASASVPVNASLTCIATTKEVSIKPEVIGNSIKVEEVMKDALGYIGSGRKNLALTKEHLILPTLYANDERCSGAVEVAKTMMNSVLTLMMSTVQAAKLDCSNWALWIQLQDGYIVGFNEELLHAWVSDLAGQYDTVGKPRSYTTPYGKQVTVSGGDGLGWEINQDATCDLILRECKTGIVKTVEIPCSSTFGAYVGVGQRDWGPCYIDVDLSTQHAYYYNEAGQLAWQANIVSGKPSSPTPNGIYTIKAVTGPTTLLGQMTASGKREYETVVQHWMPFVGNMIGFHDAYWQPKFGGDWYVSNGSHGCINLSSGDAASLRSLLSPGVVVVVHN